MKKINLTLTEQKINALEEERKQAVDCEVIPKSITDKVTEINNELLAAVAYPFIKSRNPLSDMLIKLNVTNDSDPKDIVKAINKAHSYQQIVIKLSDSGALLMDRVNKPLTIKHLYTLKLADIQKGAKATDKEKTTVLKWLCGDNLHLLRGYIYSVTEQSELTKGNADLFSAFGNSIKQLDKEIATLYTAEPTRNINKNRLQKVLDAIIVDKSVKVTPYHYAHNIKFIDNVNFKNGVNTIASELTALQGLYLTAMYAFNNLNVPTNIK